MGVALGFVRGHGLSAQFGDGIYWVGASDAWEWMTSDEGDRPHGLHLRSIDTRRRGWLDHAPQLRVWLPAHPQGEMSLVPTLAPVRAAVAFDSRPPSVAAATTSDVAPSDMDAAAATAC